MEVRRRLAVAWAATLLAALPAAGRAVPPPPKAEAVPAEPLSARAPEADADGLTPVPVTVAGGPPADEAERADHPALPAVSCPGAVTLPPADGGPPLVIAPFRPGGGSLACTLRLRGAAAAFALRLRRPPSGAYAVLDRPGAQAGTTRLTLRPVVIEPGGASRPARAVRAAASAGVTSAVRGGLVELTLPPGNAPRAVAVALEIEGRPAASFFPVTGRVELPVRTRRAGSVTVRLPGLYAGPFEVRHRLQPIAVAVPPGVAVAVVRAISTRGEAREEVVDLAPPTFPTLAVLWPAGPLIAGKTQRIVVAAAGPRGAAARGPAAPTARADRGSLGRAVVRGPGLWSFDYRAPATPGAARITISGPAGSGSAERLVTVSPGGPHQIRVTLPRSPLGPGDRLRAPVVVRDAAGTALPDAVPAATLGGVGARVERAGDAHVVVAAIPDRLPAGGQLPLVVTAGAARLRVIVPVEAGPPARARLRLRPAGRRAVLTVDVADRQGNPVPRDAFAVRVTGGRADPLQPDGAGYVGTIEAAATARRAVVGVEAGGRTLARGAVGFSTPPGALLLGVWAGGGWQGNLGAVSAPRFGGGAAIRRGFGPVELALAAGVEGLRWSDSIRSVIAGAERDVSRHLVTVGIPVALRGRLPLPHGLGVGASAAVVPTWADGSIDPGFQEAERFTAWVVGVRGELTGDLALGPGRLLLGVGYGRAVLKGTPITGNVEGLCARLAYEWWLWDPGR